MALSARGIILRTPDGSFNLDNLITRGEAVYYFGQLLQSVRADLIEKPVICEISSNYADIFPDHWMMQYLPALSGTGATACFACDRFRPDSLISRNEIRSMGQALIDYFTTDMLICWFDGVIVQGFAKGAAQSLSIGEWSYSSDGRNWKQISINGEIKPEFSGGNQVSLYFRHSGFADAGPLTLNRQQQTVLLIKLQEKKLLPLTARLTISDSGNKNTAVSERERIRQRLARIRGEASAGEDSMAEPNQSSGNEEPGIASSAEPEFAVATGCELSSLPEKSSDEAGSVDYRGRITDALTGEPVSGAIIILAAKQYIAGSDGSFVFAARPQEMVDITVYSEGYDALTLRHRAGYRSGPLALSLKPRLSSCSGVITDHASGLPVSGAVVKIGDRTARSAGDGSYVLKGVKPGYHQISVFARDFMEAHEIAHIGNSAKQEVNLQIRPVLEKASVKADEFMDSYN
jgi:hypothetical protein